MYVIQNAKRLLSIEPNIFDKRFFILVQGNDNKTYQVNGPNQKSNINEFISNCIGLYINAPVLKGTFIKFTNKQIKRIKNKVESFNGKIFQPDMSNIKNNILFGIEWKNSIISLQTNRELEIMLEEVSNKKSFYSLYAYDQYLKNFDRHIGNHLIVKEKNRKPSCYYTIDGDRIFGNLTWTKVIDYIDDYSCLFGEVWHKYLYELIDEEKYIIILDYSFKLNNISTEKIKNLINILSHIYTTTDKKEYAAIKKYLEKRKKNFYKICLENATCFPNINQQRIL